MQGFKVIALITAFCLIGLAVYVFDRQPIANPKAKTVVNEQGIEATVSADELYGQARDNVVNADKNYKGKLILVTHCADLLLPMEDGKYRIALNWIHGPDRPCVIGYLDPAFKDDFANLKHSEKGIDVAGVYSGAESDVTNGVRVILDHVQLRKPQR